MTSIFDKAKSILSGKPDDAPTPVEAADQSIQETETMSEVTENTGAQTDDGVLPTEEDVRQALKSVYDPEIGISIIDLGLVYGVQIDDDSRNVLIDMTLTTPACPLGPIIKTQAHAVLTNRFPAVNDVDINLVWTPRWDPRIMASEEAKAELGIW
jgi:metal-sulfur cluster biosynthetic enzyme